MIATLARALARRPFVALVLALIGIGLCWLNVLMPLAVDDYARVGHPLTHFPAALYAEYTGWTGRLFVIALTFLSLSSPVTVYVFDVLNAFMFCALLVAAFRIARARGPSTFFDACELTIFAALLWLGTDSIAESTLWKTGAIGYLWVVTANLVVLFYLLNTCDDAACREPAALGRTAVPLFAVALFAGNGLENLAVATIAVIAFDIALRRAGRGASANMPVSLIAAYICGFAVWLGAPGNFGRLAVCTRSIPALSWVSLAAFSRTALDHVLHTPFVGVFVLAAVLAIFSKPSRAQCRRAVLMAAIAVGTAVAISPLPCPGVFNFRFAFPFDVLMLTSGLTLLPQPLRRTRHSVLLVGASAVAVAAVAVDANVVFRDYGGVAAQVREREALIAAFRHRGETRVAGTPGFFTDYMGVGAQAPERAAPIALKLPLILLPSTGKPIETRGRYFGGDIRRNPQWWVNRAFADYYGLAGVVGVLPSADDDDDDDASD